MRILIYSYFFSDSTSQGGSSIACYRLASQLKKQGNELFHIFEAGEKKESDVFEQTQRIDVRWPASKIAGFLSENKIDVIINSGSMWRQELLAKVNRISGNKAKMVFLSHSGLYDELRGYRPRWLFEEIKAGNRLAYNVAAFLGSPLFYWLKKREYENDVHKSLEGSDRVVMLTQGNVDTFGKSFKLKDNVEVIPNIIPQGRLDWSKKEKRVLILSRMEEKSKRISLALKAWKRLQDSGDFDDWHLDVVGDGQDRFRYETMVKKKNIPNVTFHGWRDPDPFLLRSSFLLVTSRYEGFCMCIPEAQTFGCLPVAFNSFPSLRYLITNGEDGFVIERFGDIDGMASVLKDGLSQFSELKPLMESAVKSATKFSAENVGRQWATMLDEITPSK